MGTGGPGGGGGEWAWSGRRRGRRRRHGPACKWAVHGMAGDGDMAVVLDGGGRGCMAGAAAALCAGLGWLAAACCAALCCAALWCSPGPTLGSPVVPEVSAHASRRGTGSTGVSYPAEAGLARHRADCHPRCRMPHARCKPGQHKAGRRGACMLPAHPARKGDARRRPRSAPQPPADASCQLRSGRHSHMMVHRSSGLGGAAGKAGQGQGQAGVGRGQRCASSAPGPQHPGAVCRGQAAAPHGGIP